MLMVGYDELSKNILEYKMNEKIKELANKAGYNDQIYEISKEGLDKFAELIVRECALQCVHNEDMDLIEKHFGVNT